MTWAMIKDKKKMSTLLDMEDKEMDELQEVNKIIKENEPPIQNEPPLPEELE